jgi:hypothetical protein
MTFGVDMETRRKIGYGQEYEENEGRFSETLDEI